MRLFLIGICGALIAPLFSQETVLPSAIYAVPGQPTKIVFRNASLVPPGESFSLNQFDCELGEISADRQQWQVIPKPDQVGDYPLLLNGEATTLKVIPENAGAGRHISLLMIGDSLTNASRYPNEIARLLSRPDNPKWRMLGTHHPHSASPDVFHEGYGGWTWEKFNSRWQPNSQQTGKTKSSPFVFWQNESPQLNFERYFDRHSQGIIPDFVTILLGINDCFHADPENPAAIEARIDAMLTEAETFLAALRKAAPETEIGICLTPPANDRDSSFFANYKNRYTRWGWRRIQFRLVQKQLEQFSNREAENIYVVPTSLGIDPLLGYPEDNGVHPNQTGYETIGREIYAWLKWRLARE